MDDAYFKKIMTGIILLVLTVLSFFILRPILYAIIIGLILALVFNPIYLFLDRKLNSRMIAAWILCIFLILLIVLPFWFFTPIIIDQSFKIYLATQQVDLITPLKTIFPSLFGSEQFSNEIGSILKSFLSKSANYFLTSLSNLILNFPKLFLQFLVVMFTFFFVLKDQEQFLHYIRSLLPFTKDVEKKLFASSKGITLAVLYGQVIIGLLQGVIVGLGFFLFGVPNALLLTVLACLAGIFPIIGTTIVWLPTSLYFLVAGNAFTAIGIAVFGLISNFIDNFLRPIIVSKGSNMPSSLILVGMIGGLFFFGVLGFILGPLILAYLLIIIEIYRKGRVSPLFSYAPSSI